MPAPATTEPDVDLEAKCQRLIDLYGALNEMPEEAELCAVDRVVNYIFRHIDDTDYEALLQRYNSAADEPTVGALCDAVEVGVRDMFAKHDPFEPGTLSLYRAIRVTCAPSEVQRGPLAQNIGMSWSTANSLAAPDFLDQYGERGGRDVRFQAATQKNQVNWLETFLKQIDPRVFDYEEIVMLPDGRLDNLVVTDPEVPEAKAAQRRSATIRP